VVAQAVASSQPWHSETQGDTAAPACPAGLPQVDGEEPQRAAG